MDLDGHRTERQRGQRSARSLCEWRFPNGSGELCGKVASHILGPTGLRVCPIHAGVMDSLVCLGLSHWAKGSSRRRGGIARGTRTAKEANDTKGGGREEIEQKQGTKSRGNFYKHGAPDGAGVD